MTIYRVENKIGFGPYRGNPDLKWKTKNHELSRNTPLPRKDFGGKILEQTIYDIDKTHIYKWKFGFPSLKEVIGWFSKKELKNLKEMGFPIKKIRVKKTNVFLSKSGKQVLYWDKYA